MIWSLTKTTGSSTTAPAKGDCGPEAAGGGIECAAWPRAGNEAEATATAMLNTAADCEIRRFMEGSVSSRWTLHDPKSNQDHRYRNSNRGGRRAPIGRGVAVFIRVHQWSIL